MYEHFNIVLKTYLIDISKVMLIYLQKQQS